MSQKSFTLIELLLVVAIIAVLATAIIFAIKPGERLAQARDATRERHLHALRTALNTYRVDYGTFANLNLPNNLTEICDTNKVNPSDCGNLVNLSSLVPQYLPSIPVDPLGGVSATGTGYAVALKHNEILLSALKSETRPVTAGPAIRVLSVYPCGCRTKNIVTNYGQGLFLVTCMSYADFNAGGYDLSGYDVVILDGADCWGGKNLDPEERNAIVSFVNNGGGFITTHDTICYKGWPEIRSILGYDCSAAGTIGMSSISRTRTGDITNYPYALPSTMSIQYTHTTSNQNPVSATRWYEVTADDAGYDVYLATYTYGRGRTAMLQWGHSAYACNCTGGSDPGPDESKIIINTLYWVAGIK
jgi:prepilin-type N-terminal cleavage/methylation domain-containing protein